MSDTTPSGGHSARGEAAADGPSESDNKGVDGSHDQSGSPSVDDRQSRAANVLQKRYRGYRSQRESAGLNLELPNFHRRQSSRSKGEDSGKGRAGREKDGEEAGGNETDPDQKPSPISPDSRWNEAIKSGGLDKASKEQMEGKNDPVSRWQRSGFYAERITGTNGREEHNTGSNEGQGDVGAKAKAMAPNKQMEAQYWLEIVDSKHRYGTNLKSYHDAWNKSDTKQNFFYWLDHGEGKDLDLDACSREQLDKERVTYLNAEQRKNYLVDVKEDGLLYWHRNGRKVDTAKGKWEDLGKGRGVGRKGEKAKLDAEESGKDGQSAQEEAEQDVEENASSSESSLYSSSDSEAESHPSPYKQKHYHGNTTEDGNQVSHRKYWTSPKAVMDVLLRKTINSNTWIYVCTTKGDLYVGIKATGGFQHSSFMYGATVASAGLLKVKNGKLYSLSPLSGHYRAGTVHFKAFCNTLHKKGVDMSSVSVSKSLLVIRGIEKYGKFSKKKKKLRDDLREKLHLGKTKEEEKQEEDSERNREIEREARKNRPEGDKDDQAGEASSEAKDKGNRKGGVEPGQGIIEDPQDSDDEDEEDRESDQVEPDMHDDKKVEELTDKERAERAIALIRSAISKGLKGERQEVVRDAKEKSKDPAEKEKQEEQDKHSDGES